MNLIIFILLIFNQLNLSFSSIPSWKFSNLAIDLMPGDSTSCNYPISSDNSIYFEKKISKSTNAITSTNVLTFGGKTRNVLFESIESYYQNQLNCQYIVCPNGKFHPKIFENDIDIKPDAFTEYGDWNLRCYRHDTGFFIMFYANNDWRNMLLTRDSGASWISYRNVEGELYDFKLTQGSNGNNGEYAMMHIGKKDGYIKLMGRNLILKTSNNENVDINGGVTKDICKALDKTQAFFYRNDDRFYYVTYNDTHLESGYSTVTSIGGYNTLTNFARTHNSNSPFQFVDKIKIKSVNLIRNTQYAYYEIYNIDKDITYHGLLDIQQNKILYNLDEEITTFIPYLESDVSSSVMLAITKDSAYKICIMKNSNTCSDSCTSNNLLLDADGNKCQNNCDDGKIKLMPEGICILLSECDTNIFMMNTEKTECGVCNYFYPDGNKYRIINTTQCIGYIPNNTEFYNENLNLLKCKENYYLDNYQCFPNPESCYEKCETCYEISNNTDDQKCLSCIEGYIIDNGNCIIPPTTVIIPPTTVIIPPTTVIIPPTTVIIPPTTVITPPTTVIIPPTTAIIPPTTVIIPPTTVITPPTTVIIPPTTVIIPPTTVIIPPTTTIIPPTTVIIPSTNKQELNCPEEKCLKCSEKSIKSNLCLECNEALGYKKVNYTLVLTEFVDCLKKEDPKLKSFYYNETSEEYRPCYKTCKTCLLGGDAESQNCLECATNYMLRPGDNPKNNCVAYSEYYFIDAYNRYKSINILNCPEEARYMIKEKNSCFYNCQQDNEYKYLYNGNCLKSCPKDTKNDSFICKESPNKSYLGVSEIQLNKTNGLDIIETLVKTYISEFDYTTNHASLFNSESYNILLYKSPNIINNIDLKMSKVDFKDCYEKVKNAYNIQEDLVISVVDKINTNNPTSYYSFFHPKTGQKLDAENICKDDVITVKENLTTILNKNDTKYELQSSLASQGINIFDINDPFYTDLCFDYKNPKKRDIPLKDRIKNVFPNITLCDEGCQNEKINLEEMTATCNCKFNDITNNNLIKENEILDSMVGEIFDLINASNILVVTCYKYIFKHFKNSIGGIMTTSIISLNLILTYIFFAKQFPKISEYISSITNRYLFYISKSIQAPPKKVINNEKNNEPNKNKNKKSMTQINKIEFKKRKTTLILNESRDKSNDLIKYKKRKSKKNKTNVNKNNNDFDYYYMNTRDQLDEDGIIKKFVKEYLETSPDEMEYDDAIKKDKRTFCEYFGENLKENQIIPNTFIAEDPIKSRGIKLIVFNMNLVLYFVINGLFISEDYISELYYIEEEDENFFSFVPRSIERLFYATIISLLIGYLTDFFFLEENKIKGIFKRDAENKNLLMSDISNLIKTLKQRYISFIIVSFVILGICLYYILCFNYVYPKTQMEWIKSSIAIFIVIQILSILVIFLEAVLRFLSFKCESEHLFKLSKLLS